MPMEKLRSTIAGERLFARAAEYDSEGHLISDSFSSINEKIPSDASSDNLLVTEAQLTTAVNNVLPSGRTDGSLLTGVSSSLAWVADEYETDFVVHEPDPLYPTETINGKVYRVADLGGKRWLAENYYYDASSKATQTNDYNTFFDVEWFSSTSNQNTFNNTILPSGWHLPTRDEWESLVSSVGGNVYIAKLMSPDGWSYEGDRGTNDTDMNLQPGGMISYGSHQYEGYQAYFWTASEETLSQSTGAQRIYIYFTPRDIPNYVETAVSFSSVPKNSSYFGWRMPIRLVKDAT